MSTRDEQINLRLSTTERLRLDRLAKHHGLGRAALLRMLIKHADDELRVSRQLTIPFPTTIEGGRG